MVAFKNIKKGLGMMDFIDKGKYAGCRVDTLIADSYEYILWVQAKAGWFSAEVISAARLRKSEMDSERHYAEEVFPWMDFDDIPF